MGVSGQIRAKVALPSFMNSCTHWTGGLAGPRDETDFSEKRTICAPGGIQTPHRNDYAIPPPVTPLYQGRT
jgi:hypothetical protein